MKFFFLFLFYLLSFHTNHAQDVAAMLREADRMESIPDERAAFLKLKEVLLVQPNNIHALSKASELCSRIGSRQGNSKDRDNYYAAALTYATKAITVSPKNDQANVSMAMILGKSSMTKSGKEKIKSAKEIKRLLDVALVTNPNNYLAWHILGRWNYEISNVNSLERAAAKVFFDGLPQGSVKNAIMYLEKAKTLSPRFTLNYFELAKAYHKNNETTKAITLLRTLQTFPNGTEDDPRIKKDALKLIESWD